MTNLLHLAVVVLHPFNLTPRYTTRNTVTTAPQALSDSVPLRSHMCVSLKSPFYCNPGSRDRYGLHLLRRPWEPGIGENEAVPTGRGSLRG